MVRFVDDILPLLSPGLGGGIKGAINDGGVGGFLKGAGTGIFDLLRGGGSPLNSTFGGGTNSLEQRLKELEDERDRLNNPRLKHLPSIEPRPKALGSAPNFNNAFAGSATGASGFVEQPDPFGNLGDSDPVARMLARLLNTPPNSL